MFGWLRRKGATNNLTIEQLSQIAGWIGWGSWSGVTVSERTAAEVTAVFCAARVIAEGIAQMPVRVMRETYDPETGLAIRKVDRKHWAHELLAVRPNRWQTSYEFREGMIFNAVLGMGSLAIKNTVGGSPEVFDLFPVPSGSWSVEQMPDWSLRIRVDYADKTHGYFNQSQVLYIRGPSFDGFTALPAVQAAREAIGLSKALEKQQAKLAGNGGKPSGVLSFAGKLAPETVEKLRETWQSRFGPNGDGGIAVLDGDAKFHSMTMTSVDAQHLETRRMQIEEIARAFRVQPIMLMQSDKAATFASAEQMFRNHVIHTLGPWIERWEQACNRDILGNEQGVTVDLDERNLLRGDFKDQAEYYTKALGAGGQSAWMTVNEIREEVGRPPIDEAWANTVSRGAMMSEGQADGSQTPTA
jgi:HK97 family phage portal protein